MWACLKPKEENLNSKAKFEFTRSGAEYELYMNYIICVYLFNNMSDITIDENKLINKDHWMPDGILDGIFENSNTKYIYDFNKF